MNLYLDDMRPVPDDTWTLVKTVEEAKALLWNGNVIHASLDHDLGACDACLIGPHGERMTPEEWLDFSDWESMPNCTHFGTGYDLVCWMEEYGIWPAEKPTVHSANPSGGAKMRDVIDRNWQALQMFFQENPGKSQNDWRCATTQGRINYIRAAND